MNQNSVVRTFLSIVVAVVALMSGVIWLDQQAQAQNVPCYQEQGGAKWVAGVIGTNTCEWEVQDGATLDLNDGAILTYEDVTVSGPVRFGTASNVVTGTTIAHGIGTTPTSVILTPQYNGALTQSLYVMSTDATNITVGLESGSVVTVTTVNWLAGK